MLTNGKVLNEVLITARHDCVEVFVLNHTNFSVMLKSLPFFTVRYDGLATYPLIFIFFFCGVMIGHWSYFVPRLASDKSLIRYASKYILKMRLIKRRA